jgi:predicted nucleotidyltransferase component of viral defense system
MLEGDELADIAAAFGVAEDQVRRDHLISHLLHALAQLRLPVVFFGGTALSRTYLRDPSSGARLSEDIDLYTAERKEAAAALDERLPRLVRREFPRIRWEPTISSVRSADAAQLVTPDGIRVRLQLLDSGRHHRDYATWPTRETEVHLRYRDVPATAMMSTPTLAAFVAMKTVAWADRRAARDLYDLAGLARIRALTREAADLVKLATGLTVGRSLFTPTPMSDWETQLVHQTLSLPPARQCLDDVSLAYAEALNWPPPFDPFE